MNKKEKLYHGLSHIDPKIIEEAETAQPARKKTGWQKWATMAACLCLVIGGVFLSQNSNFFPDPSPAGGPVSGGYVGVDGDNAVLKSIAVYPATEDFSNVKDATLDKISEDDAYGMELLGNYLPGTLPSGYHFSKASIYTTTMKSGATYQMLRVIYSDGEEPNTETTEIGDGEPAPDPDELGNEFVIFVMGYEPKTDRRVYKADEITTALMEEIDGLTFHISYGAVYVGVSPGTLGAEDILTMVSSISSSTP